MCKELFFRICVLMHKACLHPGERRTMYSLLGVCETQTIITLYMYLMPSDQKAAESKGRSGCFFTKLRCFIHVFCFTIVLFYVFYSILFYNSFLFPLVHAELLSLVILYHQSALNILYCMVSQARSIVRSAVTKCACCYGFKLVAFILKIIPTHIT